MNVLYHSYDLRIDSFRQHTPASGYVVDHLKSIVHFHYESTWGRLEKC